MTQNPRDTPAVVSSNEPDTDFLVLHSILDIDDYLYSPKPEAFWKATVCREERDISLEITVAHGLCRSAVVGPILNCPFHELFAVRIKSGV